MTVTNLKAIALRKHAEALFVARFCYDRARAMRELERAAAARFVYANAERIHASR